MKRRDNFVSSWRLRLWMVTLRTLIIGILSLFVFSSVVHAISRPPDVHTLVQKFIDAGVDAKKQEKLFKEAERYGTELAPGLAALIQDPKPEVRAVTVSLLAQVVPSAAVRKQNIIEPLTTLLEQDPIPGMRMHAAAALGNTQDPRALAPLSRALTQPDPMVRRFAIFGLGKLHLPEAAEPLLRLAEVNGDPDLRRDVFNALQTLNAVDAVRAAVREAKEPEWRADLYALLTAIDPTTREAEEKAYQQKITQVEEEARLAAPPPPPPPTFLENLRSILWPFRQQLAWVGTGLASLPGLLLAGLTFFYARSQRRHVFSGMIGVLLLTPIIGVIAHAAFSAPLHIHNDPGSALILLLPFFGTWTLFPIILCAYFLWYEFSTPTSTAVVNAVVWSGVYFLTKSLLWLLLPFLAGRDAFWWVLQRNWMQDELGYAFGVFLLSLLAARWRIPAFAFSPSSFAGSVSLSAMAITVGFIFIHLYSS